MSASLKLTNISKAFGQTQVLHQVSLDIQPGEFVSLLGPSGCGKSTLLRIIAGLIHADEGDVQLNAQSVIGLKPNQRNIAMVFQNYALYPHMTVRENIATPLVMSRMGFGRDNPCCAASGRATIRSIGRLKNL